MQEIKICSLWIIFKNEEYFKNLLLKSGSGDTVESFAEKSAAII